MMGILMLDRETSWREVLQNFIYIFVILARSTFSIKDLGGAALDEDIES